MLGDRHEDDRGLAPRRYQSVESREKAEAMLGDGIALPPGIYAFTDGNDAGGVGVVVLDQGPDSFQKMHEVSTTVVRVFADARILGLESEEAVAAALARSRNILAELAALYHALSLVPAGTALTLVYDYKGVGLWMQRRWKTKAATVAAVVGACRELVTGRHLKVTYRHQRGHQSSWAGRDDYAYWNGRADSLATRAGDRVDY